MSPETAERLMASYKKEEICFKYFYKSITEIIKNFPSHQFLIRPHPVEKEELYIKYFEMFNNVVVSKNGTINQLISGAELVIHSDCTSALQAYLMQVPVISVAYPYKDMICAPWSLSFGETPQSVDDIKELINCMLVNKNFPSNIATKIHKNAKKTIETMFGNIGNSSEEIASIMTAQISERFKNIENYEVFDSRTFLQKLKLFVRKLLPLHYKVPLASRLLLLAYSKEDICTRLALLNKKDVICVKYNVKKIFPNTYHISRK
jgi:hypothetical protein